MILKNTYVGRGESEMYYDAVKQISDTVIEITDANGTVFEYDLFLIVVKENQGFATDFLRCVMSQVLKEG